MGLPSERRLSGGKREDADLQKGTSQDTSEAQECQQQRAYTSRGQRQASIEAITFISTMKIKLIFSYWQRNEYKHRSL